MPPSREQDFETFLAWMSQLDHEDYLMLLRSALGILGQPICVVGYILAKHYNMQIIVWVLIWANFLISIAIFAATLAAFIMFVVWSSFLCVEVQTDFLRKVAMAITLLLTLVGIAVAIGLGTSLGGQRNENTAFAPDEKDTSTGQSE